MHKVMWGKSQPYHPLIFHMIDAGNVANVLMEDSVFSRTKVLFAKHFNIGETEAVKFISFIVACHDIGKCHPLFQMKDDSLSIVHRLQEERKLMPGAVCKGYHHEFFSSAWMKEYLRENGVDHNVSKLMGDVLTLHHQRKGIEKQQLEEYEIDEGIDSWWKEQRTELLNDVKNLFNVEYFYVKQINCANEVGVILTALIILSDWIASNTDFFPAVINDTQEEFCINHYSRISNENANSAITALGFKSENVNCIGLDFVDVWKTWELDKNYALRPLQATCEKLIKENNLTHGLTILEAPMGEGKTEAAIYIAMQWIKQINKKGIYFALPTATTSNQMYNRVKNFLEYDMGVAETVKLIHATAWMLEESTDNESEDSSEGIRCSEDDLQKIVQKWFAPNRVGLLKPWAVGTVDQAMSAALQIRFGVLRWLGLSQKVLIIDEVHAYDIYMETIIERLLEWCKMLNIPVVLLSATLPTNRRKELMKAYGGEIDECKNSYHYPVISHVGMDGKASIHAVEGKYEDKIITIKKAKFLRKWDTVAQMAVDRVKKDGGCVGIVVNTVNDAQLLYEELCAALSKSEVNVDAMLFHARFTLKERECIEKKCLELFDKRSVKERRKPTILVATQVVEQSLDLDFDWMISSIAPMDLLLQRIGRLHRHTDRVRPDQYKIAEFVVLVPENDHDYGANAKVYAPWLLCMSEKNLPDRLNVPKDIRNLVERVYSTKGEESTGKVKEFWVEMENVKKGKAAEASQFLLGIPRRDEFSLTHIQQLNEDADDNKTVKAKTRAGDDSIMLILVEEQEFKRIMKFKNWNNKLAKKLLANAVSVPIWKKPLKSPAKGYQECDYGKGKLSHALVVPMKIQDGKWLYEWKLESGELCFLENNKQLGIVIRRRSDGE